MDKSQTVGLDVLLSNEKTRSLPVNGDCGLFANYSVCYSRFACESLHLLQGKNKKTARTSINTGFLAVLAEKEGFEPSRRFPDLLP